MLKSITDTIKFKEKHMRVIIIFLLALILSACSALDSIVNSEPEVVQTPVTILVESGAVVSSNPEPVIQATRAQFAYISDSNGRVLLCNIALDNGLDHCKSTGLTPVNNEVSWLPDGFTIHTVGNIRYAYIASNSSMFKCTLNTDNSLIDCVNTGTDSNQKKMSWLPNDVVFNSTESNSHAYISAVKSIYKCSIDKNGDLVDCNTTGYGLGNQAMSWVANSVTFNHSDSKEYAYVSGAVRLYKCELSSKEDDLINCAPTGTDAKLSKIKWHPKAINFSREKAGYYAYVSDPSKMYECNVDGAGGITNCNAGGLYKNNSHWQPENVRFTQIDNTKYAYVVGIYSVFLCGVGKYGALVNCNETGLDTRGSKLQWNPKSIYLIE